VASNPKGDDDERNVLPDYENRRQREGKALVPLKKKKKLTRQPMVRDNLLLAQE
jgi:hypothetical protein